MNEILVGAISAISFVIGLFFLRFWSGTRDRFFLFFAISFWMEAINRILLAEVANWSENSPPYYLVRLLSYLLIIAAVVDKNRSGH